MQRIFLFLFVCASFSACKKTNNDIPDVSSFFGRFNGFAASITNATPPGSGVATSVALNVPISASQSNGSYTSVISGRDFSVSFTKATLLFSGILTPSSSEFQGFFSVGNVPYLTPTVPNGIAIGYVDKNGVTWNSALGDQTGSVFTINQTQTSGISVKIEAVFNCILYDSGGNKVMLTGGMFTGQFKPL